MDLIAAREVDNNEKMRALRNLHIAQEVYAKTKIEKDRFERQCQIEDVDFKEFVFMKGNEIDLFCVDFCAFQKWRVKKQLNRERSIQSFSKPAKFEDRKPWNSKHAFFSNYANHELFVMQNLMSLKAEGLQLNDSECEVCYLEFTPVMTYEEQKALRLTHSKFEELNRKESTEERCWRNKALPCGHAKVRLRFEGSF